MSVNYLSSPMLPLPSAAAGVTVTSNTTPWADSAWVEIDPSIANDSLLATITAFNDDNSASHQFELDIGVGGSGSEVVVTTVKGVSQLALDDIGDDPTFVLPIQIEAFTAGDRVSARIRTSTAAAIDWRVAITVIEVPYAGNLLTTANPIKVTTPGAAFVSASVGLVGWVSSAYQTVIASAAADLVLVGFAGFSNQRWEIDLAIGSAGNEVVFATVRGLSVSFHGQVMFTQPLDVIASGDRVSMRLRSSTIAVGGHCALMYIEKPL